MAVPKTGVSRRKSTPLPWSLTTFEKVEFPLLFQKPIQDPSTENRHTVPEFGFAEFFSFCTRLLVKQEFPAAKALVGMTGFDTRKAHPYQNAVSQSLRIQLALNSLIRPPVSLAEKHSKAETGKQSENSASPNSRVLAQGSCTRDGFFDAKTKLCATKNRHNYLKFCAFAKKNAVSLTNQGCKGCQNKSSVSGKYKPAIPKIRILRIINILIYGSQPLHNTKLLQC